ncbi:MAG: hypothetical protein BWY26_00929 [Elusimicrobia bacterium ADurb.Bin231]|nr:MAG: hypothetical protein BWY26_00929 [Elusimicrobia bacterium ADurb.Bin231]
MMKCSILYPFDTGLELDFKPEPGFSVYKTMRKCSAGKAVLFNTDFGFADMDVRIYKFGCGLLTLSFAVDDNLQGLVNISCLSSHITIDDLGITEYCKKVSEDITKEAESFSNHKYETKLSDSEFFPVFTAAKLDVSPDSFIKKNLRILYGIISSDSDYEKFSEFILRQDMLINYGYYEDEIILIKRFGAFIASEEADIITDVIKLVIARWWLLRSYDYALETELDDAQKYLSKIPSGIRILGSFVHYNRFSRDSLDFSRENLEIISSVHSSVREIDSDWHLSMLYKNIGKIFNTEELYKWVETKITRIEDSYDNARDFLSTNFFILLDVIFFLSLAWSIFDTLLLWKISVK